MKGLGVPVENQWGLRPATIEGTTRLQPLLTTNDLDAHGWLEGVKTFNFHQHLPHYAVTTDDPAAIHVLARQPIDLRHPHPFTEAGHRDFNMFLWMPPTRERAGRHPSRRLDDLYHAVRRRRESGSLLEKHRDAMTRHGARLTLAAHP